MHIPPSLRARFARFLLTLTALSIASLAAAQDKFITMAALGPAFDAKHLPEVRKLREQVRVFARALERRKTTRANRAAKEAQSRQLEAARNRLTDLAVAYVEQIEIAEALMRIDLGETLARRYRQSFFDTLWRLGERAKSGDARAQATLGALYRLGVVAERDDTRSCSFYRNAAEWHHVAALYHAAACPGTPKSYLERAAAGGHPAAQEMLGRACLKEKRDAACALDWLARAGEQRRASALSLLAFMYATGELVPKDEKRAFTFAQSAATLGDAAAQNNVGQMYELGHGAPADPAQAFVWYRRAAQAGFGLAQVNLARCYIEGRGTARDPQAATAWLTLAQGQGVKEAGVLLQWLSAEIGRQKE